jgi:hypothetical protein
MVKCKCHRICGVGGSDNYYRKSCWEDVVSTANWNHKAINNVFWKGNESMPIDGTLECICAERRVESFPTEGKVCSQTFGVNSSNLAQKDSRDVC